MIRARDLPQ